MMPLGRLRERSSLVNLIREADVSSVDGSPCMNNMTGTQALEKDQQGDFDIVDITTFSAC